ncbi:hypothetical protein BO79DRAFT_17545 [Aspergillus costaricaensis CBS 115574]|uniref:Uncharacterized protein n=1 Tax=Aspergillus costaricaensis CBS 115574 TaxID=1448317 RepID=A0ACD1IEN4_9EURO|nr:hypothetical protein BO79DRAFT_17545 [Aspergillus costaricaensis CBS 115574]RAK88693.1 hypothetical protein BO79DRAFT_17545 [Aspergillus costaricaensis CBS 115574]
MHVQGSIVWHDRKSCIRPFPCCVGSLSGHQALAHLFCSMRFGLPTLSFDLVGFLSESEVHIVNRPTDRRAGSKVPSCHSEP